MHQNAPFPSENKKKFMGSGDSPDLSTLGGKPPSQTPPPTWPPPMKISGYSLAEYLSLEKIN